MRVVELGRTALQAEILRVKAVALRNVRRVVFLTAAGVLALFAFAASEVALFFVFHLDAGITPAWSAVIVGGLDLSVALLFAAVGAANRPGPVEIEARMTRDRTLAELRNAAAIATVTGPAGRLAGRSLAGLARRIFSRRRRAR